MSWDVVFYVSFLVLLFLKAPIAIALSGSSLIFLLGSGISLKVIPQIMATTFDSFVLLAIPLFMFAGELMNSGGITTRLFTFVNSMVGHIRGSLSHVNVINSMIFAGMSGSAVADAAGIGAVELRAMQEAGYDTPYAAALTAASSAVGPIIPPSISMVLYGSLTGTSVGALFLGGFFPGVLMGLFMLITGYFICKKRNYPCSGRKTWNERFHAFIGTLPALMTPVLIIGGILSGVCTPTEAAAIAAVYTICLGLAYRELTIESLRGSLLSVGKNISAIMFIVCSAAVFGWILAYVGIPSKLASTILGLSDNKYMVLLILNIFLLFIGLFMESIAIILILVPMLMPVIDAVGIDRVHFGVVMAVNIAIGLCTPPVGVCLYIVARVGQVSIESVIKAIMPLLGALLAALAVTTYFPPIVLWLPSLFF